MHTETTISLRLLYPVTELLASLVGSLDDTGWFFTFLCLLPGTFERSLAGITSLPRWGNLTILFVETKYGSVQVRKESEQWHSWMPSTKFPVAQPSLAAWNTVEIRIPLPAATLTMVNGHRTECAIEEKFTGSSFLLFPPSFKSIAFVEVGLFCKIQIGILLELHRPSKSREFL